MALRVKIQIFSNFDGPISFSNCCRLPHTPSPSLKALPIGIFSRRRRLLRAWGSFFFSNFSPTPQCLLHIDVGLTSKCVESSKVFYLSLNLLSGSAYCSCSKTDAFGLMLSRLYSDRKERKKVNSKRKIC